MIPVVQGSEFDERAFFRALGQSGARVLLIGRRALIALGIPVDSATARGRGRYVLENDDHVDVVVARAQSTKDGEVVAFDDVWARRRIESYDEGTTIAVPSVADLIRTKRWAMRQKDIADIQLLEGLRELEGDSR